MELSTQTSINLINGLFIIPDSVHNFNEIIECIEPNIKIFKYSNKESFQTFKSNLTNELQNIRKKQLQNIRNKVLELQNIKNKELQNIKNKELQNIKNNQLKLVGWIIDNNGNELDICSDYKINLSEYTNIEQYQNILNIINLISEYVDTNIFDLKCCDYLGTESYNRMIKILKLGTKFTYTYPYDLTVHILNSQWINNNIET